MSKTAIYLGWGFIIFMGVAIVIIFIAWMAPLFFALVRMLVRPIINIFKKSEKE